MNTSSASGSRTRWGALVDWIDQTFTDLLPLWSSVYREG